MGNWRLLNFSRLKVLWTQMDVLDIANVARVQCQAIRQEDSRTDEVFMAQSPLPLTSKRRSIRRVNLYVKDCSRD